MVKAIILTVIIIVIICGALLMINKNISRGKVLIAGNKKTIDHIIDVMEQDSHKIARDSRGRFMSKSKI